LISHQKVYIHSLPLFCKMGQSDIIFFLRKSRSKWFNANDIAKRLNISIGSVLACLRRLRKANLIEFRNQLTKVGAVYKNIFVYRFKGSK
jgi:DNA-binding MarR family transcriptional regulator